MQVVKILLRELINELPEDQKEIVILRIYHNLGFKKIAEMKNLNKNTALARMQYAKNKLKKKLLTDPRGKIILDLVPKYKNRIRRKIKPNLY